MTRTHTMYFADYSLEGITAEFEKLRADWTSRKPHIHSDIAELGDERLLAVELAIKRLKDRVD